MKTCTQCGEEKDLSAFYKDQRRLDGVRSHCKQCHNDAIRRRRIGTYRPHANSNAEYFRTYRRNNPEKIKAKSKVQIAIKRGELAPASACQCNDCSKPAVDLHHHSYEPKHWLDVVPLCASCHRIRHAYPERFQ